jgi:hypothetical protein
MDAHGFNTPLLITVQPVQVVLLPAPVIDTTCAFNFVEKEKKEIITNSKEI